MAKFIARSTLWGTVQTGPLFYQLPFDQREAVTWHELGHIRKFHAWIRLWWIVSGKCFRRPEAFDALCREQEHEADQYAADAGHVRGLIRLLMSLPPTRDPAYPSPTERIQRLMSRV